MTYQHQRTADNTSTLYQRKERLMKAKQPATISKFLNIQFLYLFLIFPLFLLMHVILFAQYLHTLFEVPIPSIFTIAVALLFFFILAAYLLYRQYSKKQTAQNYQELLKMQKYQKKHYERIQQQRSHLENIKNNFESQLTSLCSLLDTRQTAEVLELLHTLTKEIESTKEYPFCPNAIINAVLSNKEQVCLEHQIAFHADLQIGFCDSVDKTHLCSMFSNLLDNAIEAGKKIMPPTDRYIQLIARQSGDYLHIKVRNPSLPPASPKEGHGYGQKILVDIAATYSGQFRMHYENHVYEAYLCIQMP